MDQSDTVESSSTSRQVAGKASQPPRDPFARARPTDVYWIQLKPLMRGQQIAQIERLGRITVIQERAGPLELFRLRLTVEGDTPPEKGNVMELLVDHRNRRVRFGPIEEVRMQPAQRGLGGFMLSRLIFWCQQHYGDYAVTPIILHAEDAPSEESRSIRERWLRRAGFDITYSNPEQNTGRAQVNRVDSLISSWNPERVAILQVPDLLHQLREQEMQVHRQNIQIINLQRSIDNFKSNDLGQRFAIGCLIVFAIFQALMLLWIVLK
ncbi:MAG: hypothetical protein CVV16_01655 [Gammaproteobacteria bacterium HGW-Gammaproteobacteria-6]|nr:MAG: hypothetical protein CVV16_01655 [Gammaproteobacteria bacterium HGW-Gammaproteobacteria-6]